MMTQGYCITFGCGTKLQFILGPQGKDWNLSIYFLSQFGVMPIPGQINPNCSPKFYPPSSGINSFFHRKKETINIAVVYKSSFLNFEEVDRLKLQDFLQGWYWTQMDVKKSKSQKSRHWERVKQLFKILHHKKKDNILTTKWEGKCWKKRVQRPKSQSLRPIQIVFLISLLFRSVIQSKITSFLIFLLKKL